MIFKHGEVKTIVQVVLHWSLYNDVHKRRSMKGFWFIQDIFLSLKVELNILEVRINIWYELYRSAEERHKEELLNITYIYPW